MSLKAMQQSTDII